MIGLISGAVGLGSSVFGGIKANKARKEAEKEQRRILNQMAADNESNFLRDYYQDAFDDPSSRSYLKRISEEVYDRNKGIENSGISSGATHENSLAAKESANKEMGRAINDVVINNEGKKQAAKNQYIQRKNAIASGNMELTQQQGDMKAQNWSTLGGNLADSITGLASTYLQTGGNLFSKPKSASATGSTWDAFNKQVLSASNAAAPRSPKLTNPWSSF